MTTSIDRHQKRTSKTGSLKPDQLDWEGKRAEFFPVHPWSIDPPPPTDLHAKWLNDVDSLKDVPFTVARSQTVARIADRTASQHICVLCDVIGPFDITYGISYWKSFGTVSLSPAVFEIFRCKPIGIQSLTFQGHVPSSVSWPCHVISHMPFPIGGPLEPSLYL